MGVGSGRVGSVNVGSGTGSVVGIGSGGFFVVFGAGVVGVGSGAPAACEALDGVAGVGDAVARGGAPWVDVRVCGGPAVRFVVGVGALAAAALPAVPCEGMTAVGSGADTGG